MIEKINYIRIPKVRKLRGFIERDITNASEDKEFLIDLMDDFRYHDSDDCTDNYDLLGINVTVWGEQK